MSIKIALSSLDVNQKKKIQTELMVSNKNVQFEAFTVFGEFIFLPFNFGKNITSPHFSEKKEFALNCFKGELRSDQNKIEQKCLDFLNTDQSVILSACPGFGKTITSISIICHLRVKTVLLTKQRVVVSQWLKSVKEFAPDLKVQEIKSRAEPDESSNVYIINPIVLKTDKFFFKKEFEDVAFVIVDEFHQVLSPVLIQSLFKFQPKYFMGLSATPYRYDEYNKTINWFFGKNFVENGFTATKTIQPLKPFTVYIGETDFTPVISRTAYGKPDWNKLLNDQAESFSRNTLIVNLVSKLNNRVWLILVKRISHAETLQKMFAKVNVSAETFTGKKKTFDRNIKVLIGTTGKVGVGFDHPPINALFLAADVKNYLFQYLGRCMRTQQKKPIVIDLKDKCKMLEKHLKDREKMYKSLHAEIKIIKKE